MKEKLKNDQEELQYLVNLARLQNVAKNQKEFAKIVGLDPGPLSSMLSGAQTITSQMMKRIKDALSVAGLVIEGSGNATATGPNSTAQVLSGDLSALIKEMGEQRVAFMEQLRMKDQQIAECMQLLKDAMASPKK